MMTPAAQSHMEMIEKCQEFVVHTKIEPVGDVYYDNGIGFAFEHYDTEGWNKETGELIKQLDGESDIIAMSHLYWHGGSEYTHSEYPLFYVVDYDYDGQADFTLIDRMGDGNCSSLEVYLNLNMNKERQKWEHLRQLAPRQKTKKDDPVINDWGPRRLRPS